MNWLSAMPRSAALLEPLRRGLVVGALAAAVGVEHGQIVHRLGVAAFGGLQVIAARDIDVLLRAETLFQQGAEPEDRRHDAGLRRRGRTTSMASS